MKASAKIQKYALGPTVIRWKAEMAGERASHTCWPKIHCKNKVLSKIALDQFLNVIIMITCFCYMVDRRTALRLNSVVPNAPFLYPFKISENLTLF